MVIKYTKNSSECANKTMILHKTGFIAIPGGISGVIERRIFNEKEVIGGYIERSHAGFTYSMRCCRNSSG